MCGPQRPAELDQGGIPDAAEGGADGDEPGRVRHDAQAVAVEGRSHRTGVDLVGIGGGRLQGEVHEVEAVSPEPVDLFQRVTGRMVHRTELHGNPSIGQRRGRFLVPVRFRIEVVLLAERL